ncbi:MAG: hypothetical protein LAO31_12205 [Acidobacteriia bacterium]|nr:hypothetical protein [Terriglobia bacterium]
MKNWVALRLLFVLLIVLACALLALATNAFAQPSITDVVNAAARIPSGFPGYGIAQGALFAVTGAGLGPDTLQQASFPLPTTGGLAGISVTVQVGGTTVNAILVYVSAHEVGAILPSSTPIGTGTVTVNNGGVTATAPITVVSSAFGAFSLDYFSGTQSAAAFNVAGNGSTTLNLFSPAGQSAVPGQTVMLNGTGLGAISSNETQSGATDVPNVQIKVFVGTQPATVVSAGRGTFPGLPAGFTQFPVPIGIAAWDVIRFIVPNGATGCRVPVAVQTGSVVSNFAWIAISSDGGPCVDLNTADFGDTVTLSGTVKTGTINLLRTTLHATSGGLTTEIGTEIGSGLFIQFAAPAPTTVRVSDFTFGALANNLDPGTCLVQTFRTVIPANPPPGPPPPPPGNPTVFLDAGAAINLKNAAGATQQLKKSSPGTYGGGIGSSFSIPGLPPDNSKLFLNPGTITADNGGGGADVPAFTGSVTLPSPPLTFENIDAIGNSIDRPSGVTVKWSGGDPNSYVNISGNSINVSDNVTLTGGFTCSERISAGQFTVPPFVTLTLPLTVSKPPLAPIGTLSLWNYAVNRIQIPGINLALLSAVLETQKTVTYSGTTGSTSGGPQSQVNLSIGGNAASSTTSIGTSNPLAVGYATVDVSSGSTPYGTAVFSFTQNGQVISEAGVPASPPTTHAEVFIDFRTNVPAKSGRQDTGVLNIDTGIAAVNRGSGVAHIQMVMRDLTGSILGQGITTLAANGHFAKFIDQFAPDFVLPPNFAAATRNATLELISDQPLSVLALRVTENQRHESLITTTPVADLTQPDSRNMLVYPQIAQGGGYQTTLFLLNTTGSVESGTIQIFDDNGAPLPSLLNDSGQAAASISYALPPRGARVLTTGGGQSNVGAGSVRVIPDAGNTAPIGAGVFGFTSGGNLVTESGIPSSALTTRARIYVDKSGGHNTGLAIADASGLARAVQVSVTKSDGTTQVANISLPANGHTARFADQLLSDLTNGFQGVMDITSTTPFAALTLRSLNNTRGDGLLTTFPIADLTRPAPSPVVFPQIADGGGYSTQIILINSTSSSSSASVNFFGESGSPLPVGK